jgi:hypothetical protein
MRFFERLFGKKSPPASAKEEIPPIYGGDARLAETAAIINCAAMSTAHILIDRFISELHGQKDSDWKRSIEYFVRDSNISEFTIRAIGVIITSGEIFTYYFNVTRPMNATKKLLKALEKIPEGI